MEKQLRDVEAWSIVSIPLLGGKRYTVQATDPNMPVADIIVVDEQGMPLSVPCQMQVIVDDITG